MKKKITALVLCLCMVVVMMTSCAKPVTAMEYEGKTITANMYSYWLSQIKSQYVSAETDTDEYWDITYSNGQTYEEKMREIVDFNVKVNLICTKLFDDMGLSMPEKGLDEIKTGLQDLLDSYGSKSSLNKLLSKYNINYSMLEEIYKIELMTTTVYDALYAKGGSRGISEEQLDEYFKEYYSRLDIIMIYNTFEYETDEEGKLVVDSSTGNYKTKTLSEEEKAAKNSLADDIMKKLEAGEDFDELKKQYNEDPQKDIYTDGYFISTNDISIYGSDIVVASQEMKIGDTKKIDDGSIICIAKKKELTEKPYNNENYSSQLAYLKDYCEQNDFNNYMYGLIDNVVVYEDALADTSIRKAALIGY